MNNQVDWLNGYILRSRRYLEKSLLVDWFTEEHGRVTVLVSSRLKEKVQSSSLLEGNILGKGSFYRIGEVEVLKSYFIEKNNLWVLFYLNELLLKFLPENEKEAELFEAYKKMLYILTSSPFSEVIIALRLFEKKLLTVLGYGFNLATDVYGHRLEAEKNYYFVHRQGFLEAKNSAVIAFSGSSLLALASERITPHVLPEISRLLKYTIGCVLEGGRLRCQKVYREVCHV